MSAGIKSVGYPEVVVEQVKGQVEEEGEEDAGQEWPGQAPGEVVDTGHWQLFSGHLVWRTSLRLTRTSRVE